MMRQQYECLECKHKMWGESPKHDGTYCPICKGPILPIGEPKENKRITSGLSINLTIRDLDVFKDMLAVTLFLFGKADEATQAEAHERLQKIIGDVDGGAGQ